MARSELFWNKPPKQKNDRAVDPLGFDALREAMADRLVPLLTGSTRKADEYLLTLIGLRWARETTDSMLDATIFNKGFAPFECALKQYWWNEHRRSGGGINVIRQLCEGDRPDIHRKILSDQRTTGLLGNYIVSLRGMNLVQKSSLCLQESANLLLTDVAFKPSRNWSKSWDALKQAFEPLHRMPLVLLKRLGKLLFRDEEMRNSASAYFSRQSARDWAEVDMNKLNEEQKRLAKATTSVVKLERYALQAFSELLQGNKNIPPKLNRDLCLMARQTLKADPFPSRWERNNSLGRAIKDALKALDAEKQPVAVILLRLHKSVTCEIRRNDPWLNAIGEKSHTSANWKPGSGIPDFRFKNLKSLVGDTNWRP